MFSLANNKLQIKPITIEKNIPIHANFSVMNKAFWNRGKTSIIKFISITVIFFHPQLQLILH